MCDVSLQEVRFKGRAVHGQLVRCVCADCAVTCPGCGGRHNEDWFHKCDNCGYKMCKYCVESRCPKCRTGQFR